MQLINKILILLCLIIGLSVEIQSQKKIYINIDWDKEQFTLTRNHWSVNDYELLHPKRVRQEGLIDYTQRLAPGIVRIHQAEIADTWSDEILEDWNYQRIDESFKSAQKAYLDASIIFNPICRWPKWLSKEEGLDEVKINRLVKLCRDLAIHIRKHPEWNIKYWEVLNEGEEFWEKRNILPQYWSLFNRMAQAVKEELPNIKVGGPAFTWPNPLWVNTFLDQCGENIDFISWHNYGAGSPELQTSELLSKSVQDIEKHTLFVKEECRKRGLKLEYLFTEYNVPMGTVQ